MEHYGAQRAQPTATGGKCTGRDRLKQAKTLRRCDQLLSAMRFLVSASSTGDSKPPAYGGSHEKTHRIVLHLA